ncbi:hypothetical protein [Actinomadura rayongensis]|nr:hypothetical protein [Actinomadura rayongensis]
MPEPVYFNSPLYLTPPSTEAIREHIRAGRLGMIATPRQGNLIEDSYLWCADNGVFGNTYPGDLEFLRYLTTLRAHAERCLFVVAPDVVADHFATWDRSRRMLGNIRELGFPAALAAQNGMELDNWYLWDEFDALFIGGDTSWKLGKHAARLAQVARDMGKHVHVGRVNSEQRYVYAAEECRAHSVDGTYLTYGPDRNLPNVLSWARKVGTHDALF